MSEFGKVEVTSTPAEISFFKALALLKLDFFTYIPNLDISLQILRGVSKEYFREKHCFMKKGCRNMGV
jgi:hypothetical protein